MGFIYDFLENIFQHLSTAGYPCLFRAVTKIYCPGCGGTRAVYLLLTGHPVLSFLYHPIVLYTVFACIYIGVRFAIDALIPPQYGSIFHCHRRDFMVLCRYRK